MLSGPLLIRAWSVLRLQLDESGVSSEERLHTE
jgi:hypothetical protein